MGVNAVPLIFFSFVSLAACFPAEIQLYCGLDITTNKITAAERRSVPHHLLGVLDPAAYTPSATRPTPESQPAVDSPSWPAALTPSSTPSSPATEPEAGSGTTAASSGWMWRRWRCFCTWT